MDRHTPTRAQKIDTLFGLYFPKPPCIEEGFETIIDGHIMSESDLRLIRRALIHYYTRIDIQTATQKVEEKERVAYLGQTIGSHLDRNEYFRCKNTMTQEEMEEHYRRKNNG